MDTRGQRVVDDSFLLLFNAHDEGMDWVLPPEEFAPAWRLVIDTSGVPENSGDDRRRRQRPGVQQGHGGPAGAGRGRGAGNRAGHGGGRRPDGRARCRCRCGRIRRADSPEPRPQARIAAANPTSETGRRTRRRRSGTAPGESRPNRHADPGRRRHRKPRKKRRTRRRFEEEVTAQRSRPYRSRPPTGCSHRGLDLADAAGLVPYLPALGVDWVYLSPVLAAEPGSGTATTSSTTVRWTPIGAATPACGASPRRRTAPATGCSSTSCPTTSGWPPRAVGVVVGRAAPRAGRPLRRYFDIEWAVAGARCGCRSSGTGTTSSTRCGSRTVNSGTTITGCRSPRAPATAPRARCWPVSTTS